MEIDHCFRLGNMDEFISVRLSEVVGFPDQMAYGGGYDCSGTVEVSAGWFRGKAEDIWISTGEIYRFYTGLRSCFERLDGEVRFANEYGELDFVTTFSRKSGHVTVKGEFSEVMGNALTFTLELDQSYIPDTLRQLAKIVAKFGDEQGVKRE